MEQKKMNMKEMLIGLGLVVFLAWFTFHVLLKKNSIDVLKEAFLRADIRYVLLGCLCMAVFINCEAANIRALMRTFKKKVPFLRSLSYACTGFYFSAITPSATGGQPMELYYMARDGFGIAQSSFTLLFVAAVYQMSVLLYGSVMAAVNSPLVMAQGRLIQWLLVFGILVNGLCSGAVLLIILNTMMAERAGRCIIGFLMHIKVIRDRRKAEEKVRNLIQEYSRGGAYLRKYPLVIVRMFLRDIVQLTALFLVPFFSARALGITMGPGSSLSMQAILSLAVTAVPLPGSVGASEGAFLALYTPLLGAGTFSLMMLSRGISFYGFLVLSGLVTGFLQFRRRRR